jgi:probable HAF family extracellular repeat protein
MKYIARTLLVRVFAFAIVAATAAVAHAAPRKQFTVINLGGSYASAINNRGDIGGYARVPEPPGSFPPFFNHAVIWENGVMQDIGASLGTPPGKAFTSATAVNDSGMFVINGPNSILTLKNGTLESLGFQATPMGINNSGTIVGALPNATGSTPFVYRDGILQDLGNLGGRFGQAISINNQGTVVGSTQIANGNTRGFIYKDGVMTELGTFGGAISMASGINNSGTIVGSAQDSTGRFIAFMTDESGVLRPFLDLQGNQGAAAINERGDIVGSVNGVGYLYSNGEVTLLQDPDWWFLIPTSINNRGQIVGTGNRRGGPFTGEAFLLIPR